MKNWAIIILAIFCVEVTFAQRVLDAKAYSTYQNSSKDSSAIIVINNGLSPRAVMTDKKDIIIAATNLIVQYPSIAERIDVNGNFLWNNVWLTTPQNDLDIFGNASILPRSDGGAYFIFEYWEYRSRQGYTVYYAKYPHIQYVDAAGNVRWGSVGKRLTNLTVDFQGGANMQHICFAPDGDIMVYWTWFNDHNAVGVENELGTFVQKVDPSNSELKFSEGGRKLFNFGASPIKQSPNGNIFMFQSGKDSVACFNSMAEKQWQLPLLIGINNDFVVGTNDYGELLLIYGTNQDIRARLFNTNGAPIWMDKILSTSVTRVIPTTISNWMTDRWIFKMGQIGSSVFCIDRNGTMCWGESGIMISERILSAVPLDNESILVAFQKPSAGGNFVYDLYLQKLNKDGYPVWKSEGIKVFENVSTNCIILPDQNGGAYLIFDALEQYEPQYQGRGTYLQKVDKDGNLGIITSIKDNEAIDNTSTTASATCYPNPSDGIITFKLKTETGNHVNELIIYDILGREVKKIAVGSSISGEIILRWDGKDRNGIDSVPGIYFYQMETKNNINLSGKFLRIR